MSRSALEPAAAVVEQVLSASTAEACIVVLEDSSEAEVRFANNRTTTNGLRRSRHVSVVSFAPSGAGLAVGVASRSGAGDRSDLLELVRASEADARAADPAEDAAALLAPDDLPALRLGVGLGEGPRGGPVSTVEFEGAAPETGFSVFAGLLADLRGAAERARAARQVIAGFAAHSLSTTYLATSTGIRLAHLQPEGTLELVARASDGSASAWAGRGTRDFSDVSLAALDERLVQRLAWSARRLELPAGRYEAVLPPDAVADLVVMLYEAASGREAEDGRSVFSAAGGATRLGDRLSRLGFRLSSDPAYPGLECTPFVATGSSGADVSVFDNGMPIGSTRWIDDGRLERLRYHRAGAGRAAAAAPGVASAGGRLPVVTPPVGNLVLELPGATGSVDDLVASTRRGLLLTCLWYIREVDPATLLLTGLTRDGVYLVEDGEVVGAVNNFRFNESPLDVLDRTVEASAVAPAFSREWGEWMSRTAMPGLRVADFNMSSVSPAS